LGEVLEAGRDLKDWRGSGEGKVEKWEGRKISSGRRGERGDRGSGKGRRRGMESGRGRGTSSGRGMGRGSGGGKGTGRRCEIILWISRSCPG
jgi:hypothetical protein